MELEDKHANVSPTLIKPDQIDALFATHAKNQLDREPQHVPPVYDSDVVGRPILHCATSPARDVLVSGGVRIMAAAGHNAPGLTDKLVIPRPPEQPSPPQPQRPGRPY